MYFQIRLLQKTFETTRSHLIPSQIELVNSILSVLDKSSENYGSIEQYLKRCYPSFYIPEYTIDNGVASVSEATFYVQFSTSLPKHKKQELVAATTKLGSFLGQTACWTECEPVDLNCFQAREGTMVGAYGKTLRYLHNQELPKAPVSFSAPQRIVMAVEGKVSSNDSLKLTNSIHKRIVSEFPYNQQATGRYMNVFTPERESIFLSCKTDNDMISHVVFECVTGITDEIIDFLANGFDATFFQEQIDLRFTMESNEYVSEPEAAHHYKSINPVCFQIAPKADTSMTKSAAASVMHSIFQVLGVNEKLNTSNLKRVDGFLVASTESLGELCVRTEKVEGGVQIRGGRASGSCYNVEIVCERPIQLTSLGAHRKFGSGRLAICG